MAWRQSRGLSQAQLAEKSGVTRAYLSRLESGQADPSLSTLRRLAAALGISVGPLLDEAPPRRELGREELDQLARAVYHPGAKSNRSLPHLRVLAQAFRERRAALGLYRPRKSKSSRPKPSGSRGGFALRRVRAVLGEKTWHALLQRIDKHAAFQVKR